MCSFQVQLLQPFEQAAQQPGVLVTERASLVHAQLHSLRHAQQGYTAALARHEASCRQQIMRMQATQHTA
jgi:hypothetical protein